MNYKEALRRQFIECDFIYEESVTSTSDVLWQLYDAGSSIDEKAVITDFQTSGRGRRARNWKTDSGCAVLMSYGMHLSADKLALLPLVIPVAVYDALTKYSEYGPLKIKWPNDIWIEDKKVAGILTDTRIKNNTVVCVIGTGVNVAHKEDEARTGLMEIATNAIRAHIAFAIKENLRTSLKSRLSADLWVSRYNEILLWRGEMLKERDGELLGRCLGVDELGRLMVKNESQVLRFNESEMRIVRAS